MAASPFHIDPTHHCDVRLLHVTQTRSFINDVMKLNCCHFVTIGNIKPPIPRKWRVVEENNVLQKMLLSVRCVGGKIIVFSCFKN
jgi:hypothetical protein